MNKRKYEQLDVMKMYSTLTVEKWRFLLRNAVRQNQVDKLVGWRYGMQSGLSFINRNGGISSPKLDLWVVKRCRDLEKAMRVILRKKYPNPLDNPKHDPLAYYHQVREIKRKRDRDFEIFLAKSSF